MQALQRNYDQRLWDIVVTPLPQLWEVPIVSLVSGGIAQLDFWMRNYTYHENTNIDYMKNQMQNQMRNQMKNQIQFQMRDSHFSKFE